MDQMVKVLKPASFWTVEKDAELQELIKEGLTASQIATRLKCTRNAAIGRATRQGYRFHATNNKTGLATNARQKSKVKKRARTRVLVRPAEATPPTPASARADKPVFFFSEAEPLPDFGSDGIVPRPDPLETVIPFEGSCNSQSFPHRTHFLSATAWQCKYPLWTGAAKIGDVCGAKRRDDSPYCQDCHHRCNVPVGRLRVSANAR